MDQYGGTKRHRYYGRHHRRRTRRSEIYDENDKVIPSVIKLSDNSYEVSGSLSINDMLSQLQLDDDLIESSYTSVGGG